MLNGYTMPFCEGLHKMEANIKSDLSLQEAFEIISLFCLWEKEEKVSELHGKNSG